MVRVKLIAAILLTLAASNGSAQEHQHAANGEKLGTVHFATSCNEIAQKELAYILDVGSIGDWLRRLGR